MATLILLVGLPGAGKTTMARRLAAQRPALRLTTDEWMLPLFGPGVDPDRRDVLEGRLVWLTLQLLVLGDDVVLDFGVWSRDERSALRSLAADRGASTELVYLPVERSEQLRRVAHRWSTAPHTTFVMTEADIDEWAARFEPPDEAELRGGRVPDPPVGWSSWAAWAGERWPSSAG